MGAVAAWVAANVGSAGLKIAVAVAVVATLLGVGFGRGVAFESARWDAAKAKEDQAIVDQLIRGAKVNEHIVIKYITRTKIIQEKIDQEPRYVTPEDDAACALPADFERMWNDTNQATDPAAGAGDVAPAADAAIEPAAPPTWPAPRPLGYRGAEETRSEALRGDRAAVDPATGVGAHDWAISRSPVTPVDDTVQF